MILNKIGQRIKFNLGRVQKELGMGKSPKAFLMCNRD